MKETITKLIQDALKGLIKHKFEFVVEHPAIISYGDYSTNVAIVTGKILGKKPHDVAELIVSNILKKKHKGISNVEVAGPGFINFHLAPELFTNALKDIIKKDNDYGGNDYFKGKKIMIEHTNLNPFKLFHIGHLVNHSIGESLSRLLENSGAEVKRVSYGGDTGLHVAKTVWTMRREPYKNGKETPIAYLGRMYVLGNEAYELGGESAEDIKLINGKIFDRSDESINTLYGWGKRESLTYFDSVYTMLDVAFAYQFFESDMASIGMFIVEEFLKKGIFEKSDGAVIFPGEKYGLHTRVFVTSQGLPTYETKELGLTKRKHELYPFDLSLVVTASEQDDYFKVLLKVMEFVFSSIANKTRHISHGFLRLPEGKMSSRKGTVITGESLILEVQGLVSEKIADRGFDEKLKKEVIDSVSIAAIKYSILKQSPGKDIIFDIHKSVSFEGDSGPYLQYSYVRAKSILEKAKTEKIKESLSKLPKETIVLEKLLERFGEIVSRAQEEFAPQYITTYLTELAASFNSFYAQKQIVDKKDATSPYRVALTHSFMIVMKKGLHLLGIKTPDRM